MSAVPSQLDMAADLLTTCSAPGWQRSVALLTRQAVEGAVDQLWAERSAAMLEANWRSKLTALTGYVPRDLAAEVAALWWILSRACHRHPYELAPTRAELDDWHRRATRAVDDLRRVTQ